MAEPPVAAGVAGRLIVRVAPGTPVPDMIDRLGVPGARDISGPVLSGAIAVPDAPGRAAQVAGIPGVVSVEGPARLVAQRVPNDPAYGDQWAYPPIKAAEAWDRTTGSPTVRIAVLDTGADSTHPDLSAKLDIVPGANVVQPGRPPEDDNGHGTHIAGIAAAHTDNAVAVAGTAWQARIMPVKILDRDGVGSAATAVDGLNVAVANGAHVVNMSFAGCDDAPSMREAVENALAAGVVIVAAAGNLGGIHFDGRPCRSSEPRFPASYDGVVAVGSVNRSLQRSSFSITGMWLTVAAPGGEASADQEQDGILSTYPQTTSGCPVNACMGWESGTSQAAAFVSGAVALLLTVAPSLSPTDVVARLKATAVDIGPAGPDSSYGAGLLDIDALLAAVATDQILVEGATEAGFDEWVLIANAGTEASWVQVDYLTREGLVAGPLLLIEPGRRTTLHVNDHVTSFHVSVRVRAFGPAIVAERAMYVRDGSRAGATSARSLAEAATTWYLAEGSTQPGFEEYILVVNPGAEPATVAITWQTPSGSRPGPSAVLAPRARATFAAHELAPGEPSLSALVSASAPVAAERSMYVTSGRLAPAATAAPGVAAPATTHTFAEGTTLPGFEEFLLVQNPGSLPARATVRFLSPGGVEPAPVTVDVGAGSRATLAVHELLPGRAELAAVVTANRPVLAERASYYTSDRGTDGTATTAVTALARRWLMAEGSTGSGFEEWVLVANPGAVTATVGVTLLTPGGPRPGPTLAVRAGGRASLRINDLLTEFSVSVLVESLDGAPVAVERTLFVRSGDKSGITGSEGTPLP